MVSGRRVGAVVAVGAALLVAGVGLGSATVTDRTTSMWLDCGPALFQFLAEPPSQDCAPGRYQPWRTLAFVALVLGSVLTVAGLLWWRHLHRGAEADR
ncbi:hypothetical protein [Nakamurella endophytica]|uniref:Transmembrane protein n=1 Tax=Nakamurella endophytica TaxID=1748367 RepID=A0A917SUJ1_9ACTN|nr:hypothetical protein [Nakamurella endophytica]GGL98422.1 hypothetical protein GCM10011594_17890 [Nakamurella endophytica]